MAGPALVLLVAAIAAAVGPFVTGLIVRALLRRKRRGLAWGLAVLIGLFWALGVWTFFIEPNTLVVRHVTVESAEWRGPSVRIGIIADTHVSAPHVDVPRVERLVRRMNAERPDVVALLGDYAGGHEPAEVRAAPERSDILRGVAAFSGLEAPLGRYSVLGNHDTWFDEPRTARTLADAGVAVLENRAVAVARPGGRFWIAGLADLESRRLRPSAPEALSGVPDGEPSILLTHWPDPFAEVPPRVAITLAGHTHCGQVDLPIFGRLIHASPGSERWACGLYNEGGRKIFVTGGVGVSILPVRFRAPPEIVVLTLRAPGPGDAGRG
jgi:predicted MPP superfamily phosphohydrolase